jgi:hypothetical protein
MMTMLKSIGALLISTTLITAGLNIVALATNPHLSGALGATMFVFLIVLGFSALGLFLLLPLAILLVRRRVRFQISIVTLAIAAVPLGYIVIALIAVDNRWVGSVAGALTASSWTFLNRELFPSGVKH